MYDLGAFFQQHAERTEIAELLLKHDVARVYECANDASDGSASAFTEEDIVQVHISAALLLEVVDDELPHALVAELRRISGKALSLSTQGVPCGVGI